MDHGIFFFLAAIFIIGGLLFALMAISKKSPRPLDISKYQENWLKIESQLKRDEVSSYSLAVINADKLLDRALQERAYAGNTMGERLKNARDKLKNNDAVWAAHKLRNRIAHEQDVKVEYEATKRALVAFKQALRDLGAI
jgi:hypothetical protein